jgi:NTE family protein
LGRRLHRNPTITPLVRECISGDTILVQVNPVDRPGTPRSAREILNRINEVSFNAPLLKELRMIAVLQKASDQGHSEERVGPRCAFIASPAKS